MEKAIEIKRRAQRCILNGDLDGALIEYEKLVASGDPDPYYCVLLADLLYKKGQGGEAQRRYFEAIGGYERQGLYKNAIAVCRKMSRLSIAPLDVLQRLGDLHRLDGLPADASLCYVQHAELLVKQDRLDDARVSLRLAIEVSPEQVRALERLGEVEVLAGDLAAAERAWSDAVQQHERLGQHIEAKRWRIRAEQLRKKSPDGQSRLVPPGPEEALEAPLPDEAVAPEAEAEAEASAREEVLAQDAPFDLFVTPPGIDRPVGEEPAPASAVPEAEILEPSPLEAAAEASPSEVEPEGALAEVEPTDSEQGASGADDAGLIEPELVEPAEPELAEPAAAEVGAPATMTPSVEPSPLLVERPNGQGASQGPPGLDFAGPSASPPATAAPAAPAESDAGIAQVSALLGEAQAHFQIGDRSAATSALVRAAQAYDQMERYDSAAAIYRSLGHSTDSSLQLMMLWLKNCQRRDDRREAARVSCDLGDRSLNEGDVPGAREWFERARANDPENEIALRRLKHLEEADGAGAPARAGPGAVGDRGSGAPAAVPAGADGGPQAGRGDQGVLKVRPGPVEPSTIDLGNLIVEFQKGVVSQLASDPQAHYDLAMSYREMGLLEPAVESFRVAAREPAFFLRAKEMTGRCLLDLGQFDGAAEELRGALGAPDLRPAVAHDLRYQLGLALEAAGRLKEALEEFEGVYAAQANYPDVAMKIRILRKTVESR